MLNRIAVLFQFEPLCLSALHPCTTGAHFETDAEDGLAVWVGGGVGESKKHWRNDESSPLGNGWPVRPRQAWRDRGAEDMGGHRGEAEVQVGHISLTPTRPRVESTRSCLSTY